MAEHCATTTDNGGRGDAKAAEPIATREPIADGDGRPKQTEATARPSNDAAWRSRRGMSAAAKRMRIGEELNKAAHAGGAKKGGGAAQGDKMMRRRRSDASRATWARRRETEARAGEAAMQGARSMAMRLSAAARIAARWRVLSLNCCRSSESIGKRVMVTGYLRYEKRIAFPPYAVYMAPVLDGPAQSYASALQSSQHCQILRLMAEAVAKDRVRDPVECADMDNDLVMHRDKDIDMFHLDWDFNVPVWAYGQPGLGGAQLVTEEPSLSRMSPALQRERKRRGDERELKELASQQLRRRTKRPRIIKQTDDRRDAWRAALAAAAMTQRVSVAGGEIEPGCASVPKRLAATADRRRRSK
ncbi:hypothetical protein Scep_004111 [Stephania cephalantha]|uniref:Uncharacterized protein n=1 Tax=Stephania cephalantha TaxID=152367 RepID=A0AAP0PV22_9MAGN